MAFKLRSGNGTTFKNMGTSPFKDMKTGKYEQSFESPAKQKVDPDAPGTPGKPGYEPPVKRSDLDEKGKAIWDAQRAKKKSPTGQWKGTEGQDQDKIFDSKGNHIGDWVNDKKVMHKIPNDDSRPRSKEDRAELIKNMEKKHLKTLKKSPAKQTKDTFADGSKKSARDKFNDRETAIEQRKALATKNTKMQLQRKADRADNQKSQYWYKINNKPATKAEYMKYQNKPGGDEPGKQTNDPNVSLAKISADKRTKINK
jgi:hypothetical protein